jgi:hypothetical protein
MKQALSILTIQSGDVFYIPTLDNIYFDGINLTINCTSFDTIMFLKHKSKYLKV